MCVRVCVCMSGVCVCMSGVCVCVGSNVHECYVFVFVWCAVVCMCVHVCICVVDVSSGWYGVCMCSCEVFMELCGFI